MLRATVERAEGLDLPDIHVSPVQGKLLYLLAKMVGARRILELGTLAGYSTLWLARALPPDGKLITLESMPEHAKVAKTNIENAGFSSRIELVVGEALDTLPDVIHRADGPFDLIFIDADKANYPNYLPIVMNCVRPGSLILGDNVIRKGTVLAPHRSDEAAVGARGFNALVAADDRLEAIILQQVGIKGHDGMVIARVK